MLKNSLSAYRKKVSAAANARIGEPIYNDRIDHAVIILTNIFSHAHNSVRILTGRLNKDAYGRSEVVSDALRFLAYSEHKIYILFEDQDLVEEQNQHPFLTAVLPFDQIQIRRVPDDWQAFYDFHFILADDDSYRFEHDKNQFGAVAAFGDRPGGKNLERIFRQIWESSTPIERPSK